MIVTYALTYYDLDLVKTMVIEPLALELAGRTDEYVS